MEPTSHPQGKPRKRRAGGGRAARLNARDQGSVTRKAYIQRRLGTFNVLEEEGLELIEHNADILLKEVGMEFRDDPEILDILRTPVPMSRASGCVSSPACAGRLSRPRRRGSSSSMPEIPANTITIGGDNTVLMPSWGPPFVHDLDEGRRYATIEDFRKLVKIHQHDPLSAPFRRHRVRAGRPAGQQAPLSTCCTAISAIPTAPSWARSSVRNGRRIPSTWPRSCSAKTSCRTTAASMR